MLSLLIEARHAAVIFMVATLLVACGKDAPPPQTPEALVTGYLSALASGDLDAAKALGPVEADQAALAAIQKSAEWTRVQGGIETDFYRKTEGTDQHKWDRLVVAHVDPAAGGEPAHAYVATLREGDKVHSMAFKAMKAERGMVLLSSMKWTKDVGGDTWKLLHAHYDRLWSLLEANQKDAKAAGVALDAYLSTHDSELKLLAKRHADFVAKFDDKQLMSYAKGKFEQMKAEAARVKRIKASNPELEPLFEKIKAIEGGIKKL